MKRHLTLSTTTQYATDQGATAQWGAERSCATSRDSGLAGAARTRPHLTFAGEHVWRHTLILTGKLDSHSAPELEEEIECLCQEGVTTLTLDLRQLEEIDSTGVSVIASHSADCNSRGHGFAVILGSSVIGSALAEAGAAEVLVSAPSERVARRFLSPSLRGPFPARSTAMVKEL